MSRLLGLVLLLRLAGGTPRPEDLPVEAAEPVEVEAATAVEVEAATALEVATAEEAAGPGRRNRTVIDKKRLEG